jgi:uncharacterized protein YuzE
LALITYDPGAKAVYISPGDGKESRIAKTMPMGKGKYIDVTESNEPVGLEIVLPRNVTSKVIDAIVNKSKSIKVLRQVSLA